MKTAEDIRHELDNGPNVIALKPKREPSYHDFTISAVELDAIKFEPVKFVVQDILPPGLVVLSAPPKIGKTWMDMGIAEAVAIGALFGGCKLTNQGSVLLLDLEGNQRRAQARFRKIRQGTQAPAGLLIANEWPRMGQGGVALIRQWAAAHPNRQLVIIDVWAKFRPPRPKNADAYQFDYDCVKQLQELAHELGIAILIVHHNRKAADADWMNEISGSQGIAGGADTIIIIKRDRAAADAVLHVSGRDVEEQELALKFDKNTGRWTILGDAQEHRQSKARSQIHTLLERQGPMTPKEVAEELDQPRNTVKSAMRRMRTDGTLKGAGGGKYAVV
jgi:RecA-family ATPase